MNLETIKVKRQWIKKVINQDHKADTTACNYERDMQFGVQSEETYDNTNFESSNEKISVIAYAESESVFYGEDALFLMEDQSYNKTSKFNPKGSKASSQNVCCAEVEQQYTTFRNKSNVLEKIQEENSFNDFDVEGEDDNNVIVIGKNGLIKDYYRNSTNKYNTQHKNHRREYTEILSEDREDWALNILEGACKVNDTLFEPQHENKRAEGFWESILSVFRCNIQLQEDMEAKLNL